MLDEVLDEVRRRVPGARKALLMGADGMIVAGEGFGDGPPWDLVVAGHAELIRRSAELHREAGLEPPAEMIQGSESGVLVFRAVTPGYGILLALEGEGSIGRARYELRRAAHKMRPDLQG